MTKIETLLADMLDLLRERLPEPEGVKDEPAPADDLPGEPDEALARVLFDVSEDHGDGTFAWSTALAMARAAREHIEAEKGSPGPVNALIEQIERTEAEVQRLEASVAAWKSEVVKSAHRQAAAMADRDEWKARATKAEAERNGWTAKHAALREDVERGARYWNSYESSGKHTQNVARAAGYDLTAYLDRDDERAKGEQR